MACRPRADQQLVARQPVPPHCSYAPRTYREIEDMEGGPLPGKIEALLRELKLELPAPRVPAANHMPAKRLGNVLYITCDLNRPKSSETSELLLKTLRNSGDFQAEYEGKNPVR